MENTETSHARLREHFLRFRGGVVGTEHQIETPFGQKPLVYLDWTASGRLYSDIEHHMTYVLGPLVGNTHTESTATGDAMTRAYHNARECIKRHVGANENDVLILEGSGMTGVIVKLHRMMGLKIPNWITRTFSPSVLRFCASLGRAASIKPVVFVSHLEHHSNQTSWLETIADVVIVPPGEDGLFSLENLAAGLKKYSRRKVKIGSFSACSNVTGIETPVHDIARMMHEHGGVCLVDYAASGPYAQIKMHTDCKAEQLDAIFLSPHKALGGPGSPGIMVVNASLIRSTIPDRPGGGTVSWTNPWGGRAYVADIEAREDGGTPPFLQTIRAGLAFNLKEEMGVAQIAERKSHLLELLFQELDTVPGLNILAGNMRKRQAIVSFYFEDIHYGLLVKMLNDRFGIQTRGGCSCAGTYGHYLMGVDRRRSSEITCRIDRGDNSIKPGWVRVSLHPTNTEEEILYLGQALREITTKVHEWSRSYQYDPTTNEYHFIAV